MVENKEKYRIEFSEQAMKFMDKLLDTKDEEGFKAVSEAIEKIKANPFSGAQIQTQANETLLELQKLLGKPITKIDYWEGSTREDMDFDISFDNGTLELYNSEMYKIDKSKGNYILQPVKGEIQSNLFNLGRNYGILRNVEYDQGLSLTFYKENELEGVVVKAKGWVFEK